VSITPSNVDLAVNADQDFTVTYTLTQADIDQLAAATDPSTAIDNSASASGTPQSGTLPAVTPATAETGITPAPELSLSKVVTTGLSNTPVVGNQLVYTVNVTNSGNVNIDNVNASDPGPSFDGTPGTGSVVITPTNVDLAPGADQDFTVTYTITQADINALQAASDPATAIDNSASASGAPASGTLPAPTPATAESGIVPAPELSVTKTATPPSPFVAGASISYSVEITNSGNVVVNSVTPSDNGPTFDGQAGENMLSAFSPAPVSLAPGASQVFTATYVLDQADIDRAAAARVLRLREALRRIRAPRKPGRLLIQS